MIKKKFNLKREDYDEILTVFHQSLMYINEMQKQQKSYI
jgi:hypothetical protein